MGLLYLDLLQWSLGNPDPGLYGKFWVDYNPLFPTEIVIRVHYYYYYYYILLRRVFPL